MLNIFRHVGKLYICKAKAGKIITTEGDYWAIKSFRYRFDHTPVYFLLLNGKPISVSIPEGNKFKEGEEVILYGMPDTDFVNYYINLWWYRDRLPRIRDLLNKPCEK